MSMNGSGSQTISPESTSRTGVFAARRGTWFEPTSRRFVLVAALGVGLVSFLATELMHYLLVPDLGRHHERFLAEGLSAVVVTCLDRKARQHYPAATSANYGQDAGNCRNESSHPKRSDSRLPFR